MSDWRQKAKLLYYRRHAKIIDVAAAVGKTRQTVSTYLKGLPEWEAEQALRKTISARKRKRQKLIWEHSKLAEDGAIRREHELAVAVLSAEKYH